MPWLPILAAVGALSGCAGGPASSTRSTTPASSSAAEPGRIIRPGAPGEPSRVVGSDEIGPVRADYTEADVRFMQGMIPHHAQALEMAALIADRTESEDLRRLGLRIEISQRDEIELMKRWLSSRGKSAPTYVPMLGGGDQSHHDPSAHRTLMPGMLTPDQMRSLAAARGREFDRLFLELMIGHHEGALTMVHTLFASPGAGQEPGIFQFASDVDADQRMDISRMRDMLDERHR